MKRPAPSRSGLSEVPSISSPLAPSETRSVSSVSTRYRKISVVAFRSLGTMRASSHWKSTTVPAASSLGNEAGVVCRPRLPSPAVKRLFTRRISFATSSHTNTSFKLTVGVVWHKPIVAGLEDDHRSIIRDVGARDALGDVPSWRVVSLGHYVGSLCLKVVAEKINHPVCVTGE